MGDEIVDELNLPLSHQSGNVDVGHLSALASKITSDQTGEINNVLTSYYSGENQISFNELQSQLDGLGYSHERIEEISLSAHEERIYRTENGHPSDLSPNQLLFLHTQDNMNLVGANIFTTADGRQYITDSRVREEDGTASRLFLPTPEPFDPLTASQREEVDYLGNVRSDITLTADSTTGEEVSLTEEQRIQFNSLLTTYLNSDPANRQYQRVLFRTNIQNIPDISQITDIRNILFDFMVDSDSEYDFRQSNDGLPQNLSIEQLEYLRGNINQFGTIGYIGQPILTAEDGTLYFYGRRGKTPIPTEADIEIFNNQPNFNQYDLLPTQGDYLALNVALADYVSGLTTEEQFEREVRGISQYDPDDPARDPFRADFYNTFIYSIVVANQERQFREINNGRPSQLSQLQYDYLINHPLQDGEERYYGQILTEDRGVARYQISNGDVMLIPSDEIINQQIENGVYNPVIDIQVEPITDDDLRGNLPVPPTGQTLPIIPSIDDQLDITSGRSVFDPNNPLNEPPKPPAIPLILDPNNPLILPDSIIFPDELPSGEFYNDPYTQEYVRYVDNYSELYAGFREQFRDIIVPTAFSMVGGAIGYSFGVVRNRMFINNVYSDMEKTLIGIDQDLDRVRLRNIKYIGNLERFKTQTFMPTTALLQTQIEQKGDLTERGYELLGQLNSLRGQLAGTEDDPDSDPIPLMKDISSVAQELVVMNTDIRERKSQIERLEFLTKINDKVLSEVERSQTKLFDKEVSRAEINIDYTKNIQSMYSMLYEVFQYRNEIGVGIAVGNAVGTSLSLVLSGYYMPSAISDELDIPIPDNIKVDKKEIKDKKQLRTELKEIETKIPPKDPFNIQQGQDYIMAEPKTNDNVKINVGVKVKVKAKEHVFIPTKDNGAYPLTLEQINDYKSTLQPDELEKLAGKMLIFGAGGKIEKVNNHCKSVQNPIQFTRKSISKR